MDCEAIKGSLGAWLDGELGYSEAEQIKEHLQGCPLCPGEKARLERLQTSLERVLKARASGVAFEPFWGEVRRRIFERRPWYAQLLDWACATLFPRRLAWMIPVTIVFLLGVFSLGEFFVGWYSGWNRSNVTAVESIDGHGLNVALFRESETKTTVIWLFENQEDDDESSGEPAPGKPPF